MGPRRANQDGLAHRNDTRPRDQNVYDVRIIPDSGRIADIGGRLKSARSGSQRLPRPSGLVLLRSQPALRVRAIPRADMNYVSRCRLRKQELSGALVDRAALLLALLWTDSLATWPCPAEADARPLA